MLKLTREGEGDIFLSISVYLVRLHWASKSPAKE